MEQVTIDSEQIINTEQKNNLMANISNEKDKFVINFLKSKGYKPRIDTKYLKGLKTRLKAKGKAFVYNQAVKLANNKEIKMLCIADIIEIKDIDNWYKSSFKLLQEYIDKKEE